MTAQDGRSRPKRDASIYLGNWSEREDLNLRPPAPEAGALPGCATLRPTVSLHEAATTSKAPREGRVRVRSLYSGAQIGLQAFRCA